MVSKLKLYMVEPKTNEPNFYFTIGNLQNVKAERSPTIIIFIHKYQSALCSWIEIRCGLVSFDIFSSLCLLFKNKSYTLVPGAAAILIFIFSNFSFWISGIGLETYNDLLLDYYHLTKK